MKSPGFNSDEVNVSDPFVAVAVAVAATEYGESDDVWCETAGPGSEAFEDLYTQVRSVLHAIPQRRYGLSSDQADEVVQEAWYLFLTKRHEIRKVRPWLAGTVSNLCRQKLQELMRFQLLECESRELKNRTESFGSQLREILLRQGLGRVDERSRKLCTLIALEGWSYEEVSEELDMPLGSVGPLYIRAKKNLRKSLEIVN